MVFQHYLALAQLSGFRAVSVEKPGGLINKRAGNRERSGMTYGDVVVADVSSKERLEQGVQQWGSLLDST